MIKLQPHTRNIAEGIVLSVVILCTIALSLWFLYTIRLVFIYTLVAGIISLMGRPLMLFLHNKLKLSSALSAIITVVLFLLIFIGFFTIFIPLFLQQTDIISKMNTQELQAQVQEQIEALNHLLMEYNIPILNDFMGTGIGDYFQISSVTSLLSEVLGFVSNFSVGAFSVLFISFFFLKERDLLNRMLLMPFPDRVEGRVGGVISQIKNLLSRYFLGLSLQVLVMFLLYYLLLYFVVGVEADKALLISFICACCNIVPYIGPIIGFFLITLLSLSNLYSQGFNFSQDFSPMIYWLVGGYLFAQGIDNFVNQPLIYSRSVKSHPLEIFFIIIIGGMLAGVLGVIVAVPFYTAIRVILKEFFSEFKFVQSITRNM